MKNRKLEEIDSFSLETLANHRIAIGRLRKYEKLFYEELERQRSSEFQDLKSVILEKSTKKFNVRNWFRSVPYKYCLNPLSSVGSLENGGRFNFGNDLIDSIIRFPALYMAEDKSTASLESLMQYKTENKELSPYELSLAKPRSETLVSITGFLETVFELNDSNILIKFTNIIKKFKVSKEVRDMSKKIKRTVSLIKKPKDLFDSIMNKDWRSSPLLFGIPSNSQIFGNILNRSGINGIKYRSAKNGKMCLAVFINTFSGGSCCLELSDESPQQVLVKKIDQLNYKLSTMTNQEIERIKNELN